MTLRPRLPRRVLYLVLSSALFVLAVVGIAYLPVLAVPCALFAGVSAVFAAFRLWHPRSYTTELDDDEFRVYDSLGRLVHEVRWVDVAYLTAFAGNSLRGVGSIACLAWRCEPRHRGPGRFLPWARGSAEFDGALPDDYLGLEAMVALFQERADAAKVRSRPPALELPPIDVL